MSDPNNAEPSSITLEKEKRCEEFYSNVSIGGFKYMFLESGIKQKIWIIIFFVVLISSISVIYEVIKDYSKNNFYSTYERIQEEELDLPTITICSFNSLRDSKLKKLNLNESEIEQFLRFYKNTYTPNSKNTMQSNLDEVAKILKRSNVSTMLDLVSRTENTIYDMLDPVSSKLIFKKPCKRFNELCVAEDFRLTNAWLQKTVTCSQFNPYVEGKESVKVKDYGMLGSFAVTADLHVKDIRHPMFQVKGLYVLIHPYGTPAFLPEYTYSFFAELGHLNMLRLSLRKHQRLPPPYASKCGKKDFKIIRGYPYSKAMCEVDCILAEVLQLCGCVGYEFEGYVGTHRICSIEEHACYLQNSKKLQSQLDSSTENRNKCNCPLACNSYSYKLDDSKLALGNQNRINQLIKMRDLNLTLKEAENYIKNNMVGIWIYYRNLVVLEEIQTPSVSISNLLGTVGGNMGLFISFSVITFYEIVHFLWDYAMLSKKQKSLKHYVDHDAL